jgi:MFS family permease
VKLEYEDERDIYLYDPQDGLGDILTGLVFLSFGLSLLTEVFWLSAVWVPILIPVWRTIKKRLHAGRLQDKGLSQATGQTGNTRLLMMLALGSVTFLVGLVFFTLMAGASDLVWLKSWLSTYFELVMGIFAAIVLAVVGAINRASRFYFYALLALVLLSAGYLFGIHLSTSMITLGTLITISGLVVLSRFIGEHPVINEGSERR